MTPEQAIARAQQVWAEINEIRRKWRHGYQDAKDDALPDLQDEIKRLREIPGVSEALETESRN